MPSTPSHLAPDARPSRIFDQGSNKDLGDELLIYDRASDQVHVLNGTARELYLLCDGKRTIQEILDRFADTYEVERSTANVAALEALGQLVELGALRVD